MLLASIFVALGLVPLIAIWITKPTSGNRLEEMQEEWTHVAQEWYAKHLRTFLGNRPAQNWFIASLCVGLVLSVFLPVFGVVKTVLFEKVGAAIGLIKSFFRIAASRAILFFHKYWFTLSI